MKRLYIFLITITFFQLMQIKTYGQKKFQLKVRLINKGDSSAVQFAKIAIKDKNNKTTQELNSDADGNCVFSLPDSLNNKIFIYTKPLSFKAYSSPILSFDSTQKEQLILLEKSNVQLKEVTIFEKQVSKNLDKTVYRVKQDQFSASTSTLELFNKLPGVILNRAGVKINGKDGVLILINGIGELKDQSSQLAVLASLSSDQIEKIEISSFPSVKYDASVKTIINVITKKERDMSNLKMSVGQPFFRYGDKFGTDNVYGGASTNLNFKINKVRVSLLANIRSYRYSEKINTITNTPDLNLFNSQIDANYSNFSISPNLTIDYDINKRSSINLNADISVQPSINIHGTEYDNFYNLNSNKLDSNSVVNSHHKSNQDQYEFTGNYKYQLNEKKKSFFYLSFIYHKNPFSYSDNFNGISNSGTNMLLTNDFDSQSNIFNATAIISDLLKSSYLSTEFGVKTNTLSYKTEQTLNVEDQNLFNYNEQISSAFLSAKWTFGKYKLLTGVRNELLHSNSSFIQPTQELFQTAKSEYFKIYPNILIEETVNDDFTLSLGYSKRVRRPRSIFLNPSVVRTYYTSTSGDLDNQPTYYDRLEGQALYKGITTTIYYEHSSNVLFSTISSSSSYSYQYLNAANLSNWGIALSKEFKISKWLSSTVNTDLSRTSQNSAVANFSKSQWTNFDIASSANINFGKKSRLQIDLDYAAKSYSAYTTYLGQFYNSVIFRQLLFKDGWSLNIAVADPLGLEKNRLNALYPGQTITKRNLTNDRMISFEMIYRFPFGQKFKNQSYKKKNDDEIRN